MKRNAGSWPASGFLAHRGLIAFSALTTMAEAALLGWLAPPARSLAAQLTAVPPLAVFHDMRWLYGYDRSWSGFILLLVVVIVIRSALNTAIVRLAWPRDLPVPGVGEVFRSAASLTMAACLLLSPIVTLALGVAILPFSWPYLGSLLVMLLICLPISHGGILRSWWRTLPPVRAMYWLLADFVVLSAAAAAIGSLPVAAAVPVSGLAGVVNARAWFGVTRAVSRQSALHPAPAPPALSVPKAPVATVLAIAAVIGMTRLAFVVGRGPHPVSIAAAALEPGAAGGAGGPAAAASGTGVVRPGHYAHNPVLEIRGFGSTCCQVASQMKWIAPGAKLQQFSYLGMTAAGRPLPQGSTASDLPLPELGNRIAAQVLRLHQETGRPVDIIAESEGTLGVDAMLATHQGLPLGSVVMMSPIVAPDRVTYQPGAGIGLVPANELRAVVWLVGGLSPFGSSGAQTLISSVDAVGAQFAATAARHHPVRWMLLVPLADAVTLPVCPLPPDVYVVPALHGDLIGTPMVDGMVRSFLAHGTVPEPGRYKATAELVAAAAAAWRMPETVAPSPACTK